MLANRGWAAETEVARPLLRPAAAELAEKGRAILSRLRAKSTHRRTRVASMDRGSFDGRRLKLELFPDIDVEAEYMDVGFTGVKGRTWTGRLPDGGSAAFLVNGDRVTGSIATAKGNFQIFPLGEGQYAVVEHDPRTLPECGAGRVPPPVALPGPGRDEANVRDVFGPVRARRALAGPGEARLADTPTANRVRVLVAYTPSSQNLTAFYFGLTMQELIDLAVLESNQGYANSGVTMRMELACLYETTYDETAAIEIDVSRFRGNGDGFMDEVHTLRADYDADMCCLIVDGTDPDWCGLAYGFDYTAYSNMFQATMFACATGNYTFAHEFGHTQGCRHDNDGTLTPFPYGHGFRNGASWRTIMGLASGTSSPRLNYWSNPNVNSPVAPFTAMGTPINGGNFANDNRSAINAGDNVVVDHESTPVSSTTPSGDTINADEDVDKIVTDSLTVTSFTANSGSRVQFRSSGTIL
ncbi:MAG: M12 family metallo-peptidase, partial [Limisphaerales bacterium]